MKRRDFIRATTAAAGGALLLERTPASAQSRAAPAADATPAANATPAADAKPTGTGRFVARPAPVAPGGQPPVITPNGSTLPLRRVNGVKVGHLIAQPVAHEFAPGLQAECWGYNGSTPGPTIEVVEGDRVRLYVTNRLPEPTTVHWHGVPLPNGMDGVSGLTQRSIAPGQTFKYEITFTQPGTFMYHPHFDEMTQMAMGMMGMLIVHPRVPHGPRVDRDFALLSSEWKVEPGTRRPNPNAMSDFNVLTFNSKAFPGTEPLLVGRGERVRIRLGNLSAMEHHPIHLHGHTFRVTATAGGPIPEAAQWPDTTVLVPVGSTRTIEFVANLAGDWAMHCHMTHHVMNQMGHAEPFMLGADTKNIGHQVRSVVPGYMAMGGSGMGETMQMPVPDNSIPMRSTPGPFGSIDMGGMFTLLKVREQPSAADASGWYTHPAGSVASEAAAAELAADGVDPQAPSGSAARG